MAPTLCHVAVPRRQPQLTAQTLTASLWSVPKVFPHVDGKEGKGRSPDGGRLSGLHLASTATRLIGGFALHSKLDSRGVGMSYFGGDGVEGRRNHKETASRHRIRRLVRELAHRGTPPTQIVIDIRVKLKRVGIPARTQRYSNSKAHPPTYTHSLSGLINEINLRRHARSPASRHSMCRA
uniref:Uncharacterized protein n=1 Tax=Coccidioides posadasii RMSCC 3488 TaxID=454284 RepID=A0A0J6FCM9_COCPO|nr:hypothetical protein CPAG_07082 [Coccidioides posadasii RMSCC 3488]